MNEDMSTPHPQDPAEGAENTGVPDGVPDETRDDETPLGGDATTAEQLDADNPAEEDTLKTLDPQDPPA